MIYLIIALIIITIIVIIVYIRSHKNVEHTLKCYSGTNGSGKTFNGTEDIIKYYNKACLKWYIVNKSFLRKIFKNKCNKSELYNQPKPRAYTNYPVILRSIKWRKKYEKKPISNYVKIKNRYCLLSDIAKVEQIIGLKPYEGCPQVYIDEIASWISQFINEKDTEYNAFLNNLKDQMTFFRHYHGNDAHFICSSQCTNEIPYTIRYKLNQSISFIESKHYLKFIHIFKYKVIDMTDNIKSVEINENDNKDTTDKYCYIVRFGFRKKYDNRAFSERYREVDGKPYNMTPLKQNETLIAIKNCELNNILKKYGACNLLTKQEKTKQVKT